MHLLEALVVLQDVVFGEGGHVVGQGFVKWPVRPADARAVSMMSQNVPMSTAAACQQGTTFRG